MTTKIPVELSSTPSIVDNGDATAITITSNENVLVGSSTEIATNIGIQITGTDNPAFISLFRDDSSVTTNDDLGGILFYGDDNSATTQFAYIRATAEDTHADGDNPTAIRFGTTPDGSESVTERMRITADGHVNISDGNLVIGTSGHGIDFSATANSSAANATTSAELFDDYEEGTWTPTVSSGIVSTIANSSEYTKIGDMVFAQTRITGFSDTSSSNYLQLTGLPYSVGTTESHIGTAWGNFTEKTVFFYWNGYAYFSGFNYDIVKHSDLGSTQNLLISLIYRHG